MNRYAWATVAALYSVWLAQAVAQQTQPLNDPRSEALRTHIDELRYEQGFSVRGERVILVETVATIF